MTGPDEKQQPDETETAGNTGALAAASQEDDAAGDPLGPLNAVTEDDDES